MKDSKVHLSYEGALFIGLIILSLTFMLGFMSSKKQEQITVFTRDDLEKIVSLQKIEDEQETGAQIYAYKDRKGNLMIGWTYDD